MKWLWLCLLGPLLAQAQSIGFIGSQATVCYSAVVCSIRTVISGDASGAIPNTVKVTFTHSETGLVTTATYTGAPQDVSMLYNPTTLSVSASTGGITLVFVTASALPNGNYTLVASYQRVTNSAILTSPPFNWTLWGFTPAPLLVDFPAVASSPLVVSFLLPLTPFLTNDSLAGSRQVTFINATTTVTVALPDTGNSAILNASLLLLADGPYNFTFSYRDSRPHAIASVTVAFRLDTITQPLNVTKLTETYIQYWIYEPGLVNVSWAGGWELGTALLGGPNYYFPSTSDTYTLSFTDLLLNPPAFTAPITFSLNATIVTRETIVTTVITETEQAMWQWLAIVTSSALVILLMGIVGYVIRAHRYKDYTPSAYTKSSLSSVGLKRQPAIVRPQSVMNQIPSMRCGQFSAGGG